MGFDVFAVVLGLVGIVAGALASVAGFGIGSLLTPVLALGTGAKLAVAAVAIPHLVGTLQRFWILRRHVDRRVLLWFGLASAAGGLAGAILNAGGTNRAIALVFGGAVALAGVSELTGWMARVRWGRRAAWAAGLGSGFLGGLVGNQGGIRAAALLGFQVPKEAYVATATAIALFVDAARVPVYVITQGPDILAIWPLLVVASIGVVAGTAVGARILGGVEPRTFHRIVGLALLVLGLATIAGSLAGG
ncbi:MAG TPA: sulfite exporter TauE/SafE family protein [Candidatus Limnocylindrales bacterium]